MLQHTSEKDEILPLLLFFVYVCLGQPESVLDSYVAAVYEHNVVLNPEPHVPLSRHDALQHMWRNLDVYEEQAALAAQQVWTEGFPVIKYFIFESFHYILG